MAANEIAETIISQLGGYGRLRAMAGAKGFVYGTNDAGETSVSFQIGRNARQVNFVNITLDLSDTYTVEFVWATVNARTVKSEFSGVYNDMLAEIFESATGMYLSFCKTKETTL